HGYPSARVDIQTRSTQDAAHALVMVDVQPGTPRTIDDRHVYVFGADADAIMPTANTYAVKAGDRADETAMDAADVGLETALHAAGWYRADVSHDLVWVGEAGHGQREALRVRIDSGPRQVPRFEGNEHYDGA